MAILFAILLFSLLIFVHELGHFVAAKLSGVRVNEFSMFMGPAIVKWQRGETLYAIRCIPFGGYCAMEGEDDDSEDPRSFGKAAWWKRLIILVAGSAMNFIAGVLIFAIVFFPTDKIAEPIITDVTDCSVSGGEHGLQEGDRVLSIDGEQIYVNGDISLMFQLNTTRVFDFTVERDGQVLVLEDLHTHVCTDEAGNEYDHFGIAYGRVKELDFGGKLEFVWLNTVDTVRNVRLSLQMLLTGKAGLQDISGPVGIVQQMSQVAEQSETTEDAFLNMLYMGGFIAVNLAVMNMLPIPALDGGRVVGLLLTTAVEKITRKKLNPKFEAYLHGAGMILLLILMAVILFKDVFTIFKG